MHHKYAIYVKLRALHIWTWPWLTFRWWSWSYSSNPLSIFLLCFAEIIILLVVNTNCCYHYYLTHSSQATFFFTGHICGPLWFSQWQDMLWSITTFPIIPEPFQHPFSMVLEVHSASTSFFIQHHSKFCIGLGFQNYVLVRQAWDRLLAWSLIT
jgi:hypothetical protein